MQNIADNDPESAGTIKRPVGSIDPKHQQFEVKKSKKEKDLDNDLILKIDSRVRHSILELFMKTSTVGKAIDGMYYPKELPLEQPLNLHYFRDMIDNIYEKFYEEGYYSESLKKVLSREKMRKGLFTEQNQQEDQQDEVENHNTHKAQFQHQRSNTYGSGDNDEQDNIMMGNEHSSHRAIKRISTGLEEYSETPGSFKNLNKYSTMHNSDGMLNRDQSALAKLKIPGSNHSISNVGSPNFDNEEFTQGGGLMANRKFDSDNPIGIIKTQKNTERFKSMSDTKSSQPALTVEDRKKRQKDRNVSYMSSVINHQLDNNDGNSKNLIDDATNLVIPEEDGESVDTGEIPKIFDDTNQSNQNHPKKPSIFGEQNKRTTKGTNSINCQKGVVNTAPQRKPQLKRSESCIRNLLDKSESDKLKLKQYQQDRQDFENRRTQYAAQDNLSSKDGNNRSSFSPNKSQLTGSKKPLFQLVDTEDFQLNCKETPRRPNKSLSKSPKSKHSKKYSHDLKEQEDSDTNYGSVGSSNELDGLDQKFVDKFKNYLTEEDLVEKIEDYFMPKEILKSIEKNIITKPLIKRIMAIYNKRPRDIQDLILDFSKKDYNNEYSNDINKQKRSSVDEEKSPRDSQLFMTESAQGEDQRKQNIHTWDKSDHNEDWDDKEANQAIKDQQQKAHHAYIEYHLLFKNKLKKLGLDNQQVLKKIFSEHFKIDRNWILKLSQQQNYTDKEIQDTEVLNQIIETEDNPVKGNLQYRSLKDMGQTDYSISFYQTKLYKDKIYSKILGQRNQERYADEGVQDNDDVEEKIKNDQIQALRDAVKEGIEIHSTKVIVKKNLTDVPSFIIEDNENLGQGSNENDKEKSMIEKTPEENVDSFKERKSAFKKGKIVGSVSYKIPDSIPEESDESVTKTDGGQENSKRIAKASGSFLLTSSSVVGMSTMNQPGKFDTDLNSMRMTPQKCRPTMQELTEIAEEKQCESRKRKERRASTKFFIRDKPKGIKTYTSLGEGVGQQIKEYVLSKAADKRDRHGNFNKRERDRQKISKVQTMLFKNNNLIRSLKSRKNVESNSCLKNRIFRLDCVDTLDIVQKDCNELKGDLVKNREKMDTRVNFLLGK